VAQARRGARGGRPLRRTRFDRAPCPIARATDLVGDWWTPIILRNVILGQRRFDQLTEALGVPRAILARRLGRLVAEGLLEKRLYEERPPRHEYVPTEKGRAFWDVLAALWRFGEDWLWEPGKTPPVQIVDRETGRPVRPVVVDEHTGQRLTLDRIRVRSTKAAPRS
jgi:DNA-binding HxlR family transcriptional regulator